jgi:peptidoglycan/LPS O-acetylase OafA/YrhL
MRTVRHHASVDGQTADMPPYFELVGLESTSGTEQPESRRRQLEVATRVPQRNYPPVLPGLDGWRGLALLLVVVGHHYIYSWFQTSWIAMQMFFVLSGFLITIGLLRSRERPLGEYLRVFYWRRALRIAPPYYLYLSLLSVTVLFVTIKGTGRTEIALAATYVYNFYHASKFFTHSYALTHFWSLAVEEQFYLVWPLFIYFVPRRHLARVLWSIVAAGPVLRALTYVLWRGPSLPVLADTPLAIYVLTWSHFDAFAIGALASIRAIPASARATSLALGVTALLGVLQIWVYHPQVRIRSLGYPFTLPFGYQFVWGYSVINLCSVLIVVSIAHRQFLPRLFESRFLSWLGRISYTVYIFHFVFQRLLDAVLPQASEPVKIACQLAIVIPIALFSQRYIEAPLMALKDRFWGARRKPDEARDA